MDIRSYTKDGNFYFDDVKFTFETTELINVNELVYNGESGYSYHGASIDDYIIREVD